MRKWCMLLVVALLLSGCQEADVFETVEDEVLLQVMAQPMEVRVTLPEDTVLPVMETEDGMLYMCREFDVLIQTMEGGDLQETVRAVSGFDREDLTLVETLRQDMPCYEFAWTAAGEMEEQVCRCMILDDGSYHYIVTAMVDAELAHEYQQIWNGMFESVTVS